jgi:anaerobic selenocysteine-containing dehydrogenase
MYPFNIAALERPDLIRPGTRVINMVQLAEALLGELPGPPVRALYVYNCNPAAVAPDQSRVLRGLRRDDLFTVVHEQFQTDTADYADILLPATTQLEHFDIHGSYGHFYVQVNQPTIAPMFEAKCNTDVFRLLARRLGLEPELFDVSDEELARQALSRFAASTVYPPPQALEGISLEQLKCDGAIRLNVPKDYAPFAAGRFGTPSGKCEFYSSRLAEQGLDPLPTYTPPHEDPQTRPQLAARYPLQMVSPPAPSFLNSTFVNVDSLRDMAGEPSVEIHSLDAAARAIRDGQRVRVVNDRGSFEARAQVGITVKQGVVVAPSVWWNKYARDRVNANTTTSTYLTDLGGGATFFDNLVEVVGLES